jgi:hypothetical protein
MDVQASLADPQQWNRYTYVRNNPLRWHDPDGRKIIATSPLMQNLVSSLVPENLRGAIHFSSSGELDVSALNVTTSNLPLQLLRGIAADSATVRLEFGDEQVGGLDGGWTDMRAWQAAAPGLPDFMFEGTSGRFVPGDPQRNPNTLPGGSVNRSDTNVTYVLRPTGNSGWRALAQRSLAEELLGHAWLFLNGLKWEHTYQGSAVDLFISNVLVRVQK